MRWEARLVSFEDRKPIAIFQLERIAESGARITLDELDQADLIALVAIDEKTEEERLDGLAYLMLSDTPGRAILVFAWTRPGTPMSARREVGLEAIDAWARLHGCHEIAASTERPTKQIQKWAPKYGFELSRKRELVRSVAPKEDVDGE